MSQSTHNGPFQGTNRISLDLDLDLGSLAQS